MDLENKINMYKNANTIAEFIADPQKMYYSKNPRKLAKTMIVDMASDNNLEYQRAFNIVKVEQMHIEGLIPTQLKLNLGYDEHKIYQEIR